MTNEAWGRKVRVNDWVMGEAVSCTTWAEGEGEAEKVNGNT